MTTLVTKMADVNGQGSFNPQSKYCLIKHDDDVIKWNQFPRYWPFVPVNSPHKGQWRGALMFSLVFPSTNSWVNNRDADDLRRHDTHYDVIVMDIWDDASSHINDPITVTSNERRGYSNHRQFDCLFKSLFRLTSKKTSKPALLVS